MSLTNRIPGEFRAVDQSKANAVLWITSLCLIAAIIVFLLLQRLGLPTSVVIGAICAMTFSLLIILSWISRTMTSSAFFFANRALGSFTAGIGGTSDIVSGALLVVMFSAALTGKMVLATAVSLAIVFQAALFSATFQRSGVSGLPGFFAWRARSQMAGYVALFPVALILAVLALAELQIAANIAGKIAGISVDHAIILILILAVLPSLFGGWLGLLLINATLVVWMIVCAIAPAIATGFFSPFLRAAMELDFVGTPLPVVETFPSMSFFESLHTSTAGFLLATILVLATGLSVLPHALSRLSTCARPIEALESSGWGALVIFLILGALPLSVGLIVSAPTSSVLAVLLQSQPVLQMLPFFVILFAAYNALSATIFAAASAIARAANRFRNRDPGEQSVFSTRLCIGLIAVGLLVLPKYLTFSPDWLLVNGLALAAGSLFVPLIASIWAGPLSSWSLSLSIGAGSVVSLISLSPWIIFPMQSPVLAGWLGALTGLIVIAVDRMLRTARRQTVERDPIAQSLRQHSS